MLSGNAAPDAHPACSIKSCPSRYPYTDAIWGTDSTGRQRTRPVMGRLQMHRICIRAFCLKRRPCAASFRCMVERLQMLIPPIPSRVARSCPRHACVDTVWSTDSMDRQHTPSGSTAPDVYPCVPIRAVPPDVHVRTPFGALTLWVVRFSARCVFGSMTADVYPHTTSAAVQMCKWRPYASKEVPRRSAARPQH